MGFCTEAAVCKAEKLYGDYCESNLECASKDCDLVSNTCQGTLSPNTTMVKELTAHSLQFEKWLSNTPSFQTKALSNIASSLVSDVLGIEEDDEEDD